jgi:hypothetical protein
MDQFFSAFSTFNSSSFLRIASAWDAALTSLSMKAIFPSLST